MADMQSGYLRLSPCWLTRISFQRGKDKVGGGGKGAVKWGRRGAFQKQRRILPALKVFMKLTLNSVRKTRVLASPPRRLKSFLVGITRETNLASPASLLPSMVTWAERDGRALESSREH